jgi:hypothetical protein
MMQLHPTNAKLSLKTYLNFALTYYTNSVLRQENKMKTCAMCLKENTYGLQHNNGNLICFGCVDEIKQAHIKVLNFGGY